jgi:hypothetical protein
MLLMSLFYDPAVVINAFVESKCVEMTREFDRAGAGSARLSLPKPFVL